MFDVILRMGTFLFRSSVVVSWDSPFVNQDRNSMVRENH